MDTKGSYLRTAAVLAAAFAMIAAPFISVPDGADDVYTGAPSGTGSASDPYAIADMSDLLWLEAEVNSGNAMSGSYFLMTADITLSAPWTPIGKNRANQFGGVFDGNGHIISGLNVAVTSVNAEGSDERSYAGLFGFAGTGAEIKNVVLDTSCSVYAQTVSSDDKETWVCAGGIAGFSEGTVSGCVSTAYVTAEFAYSGTPSVRERMVFAGGIVGMNAPAGSVTDCINGGRVFSDSAADRVLNIYSLAGGIAGLNRGVITDCDNTGAADAECESYYATVNVGAFARAGGIAGRNEGTVRDSFNTAPVSATSSVIAITAAPGPYAEISCGGIAGFNDTAAVIKNCANDGAVYGKTLPQSVFPDYSMGHIIAGGIAGFSAGLIEDCYNTGSIYAESWNEMSYYGGAGGIAGGMDNPASLIQNCYNTGDITVSIHADEFGYMSVGGVAGDMYDGTVRNCYSTGSIIADYPNGRTDAGGAVGYCDNGTIEHCYWFEGADQTVDGVPQTKIGANTPGTTEFRSNADVGDGLPFTVRGTEASNLLDALNAFAVNEGGLNEWAVAEGINGGLPVFAKDVPPLPPVPSAVGGLWVILLLPLILIILLDDDDEENGKK